MNFLRAQTFRIHSGGVHGYDRSILIQDVPMINRLRSFLVLGTMLGCGLHARPAAAWNSPGHMIIALMAYDQMDAATRDKADELLRAHPRFDDHFERLMPREISRGSDAEKNRWRFAHAATWPDLVRDARDSRGAVTRADVDRFSRPWWHFINQPLYLNADTERQMAGKNRFNMRRDPPDDQDDENMNIIQAIKNSSRIVGDEYAPADKR